MNIRETLRRRARRILWFGFVSWLALATSLCVAEPVGVRALPVVFFLPFLGAALAQSFSIRCPRCNGNVGLLVSRTLAPGRFRAHLANCPFCGTSFDARA